MGTQAITAANMQSSIARQQLEQQRLNQQYQGQMAAQRYNEAIRNQNAATTGRLVGGAAMVGGAALMSDVRAKEGVQPVTGAAPWLQDYMQQQGAGPDPYAHLSDEEREAVFLREAEGGQPSALQQHLQGYAAPEEQSPMGPMRAYRYRYTPGAAARMGTDTRPRVGPMAQEMQQSPLFADAVQRGPGGMLGIDRDRAQQATIAATADQDRRLRELEEEEQSTRRRQRMSDSLLMQGLGMIGGQR
jgi:hypothetical protein